MTLTQAQIDAALEIARAILPALVHDGINVDKLTPKAREEIRAAFEAVLRLTAAAEVDPERVIGNWSDGMKLRTIEARTIEQCAQVADRYPDKFGNNKNIAAAIRALKDQP